MRKSPKQDLTSATDLTIEQSEGRESPYHRIDKLTNLTYSLSMAPECIILLLYICSLVNASKFTSIWQNIVVPYLPEVSRIKIPSKPHLLKEEHELLCTLGLVPLGLQGHRVQCLLQKLGHLQLHFEAFLDLSFLDTGVGTIVAWSSRCYDILG